MINYLAGVHTRSERQQTPAKFYGAICPGDVHFLLSLSVTHTDADRYTDKRTANKISLWTIQARKLSLACIAIKSHPTDAKYTNSKHPVLRACGCRLSLSLCLSKSHMGLWGRVRRGVLAGAAAAHPAVAGPSLFTRLSRTQPAEHGPSAGIGCTHSLAVHCRFVLSTRGGNRVRTRSAAPKCRARPLARPSSRLNNSKARSGHAHVCVWWPGRSTRRSSQVSLFLLRLIYILSCHYLYSLCADNKI